MKIVIISSFYSGHMSHRNGIFPTHLHRMFCYIWSGEEALDVSIGSSTTDSERAARAAPNTMEQGSTARAGEPGAIGLRLDESAIEDVANVMVALASRPCADDHQGTDDEGSDQDADHAHAEASHAAQAEPPRRVALAQAPPRRPSRRARKPRQKVNRYRGAYRDKRDEGCRYYAQITIPAASSGTKRQRLALGLHTTAEVRLGARLLPNPLLPWPSRTRPDRPFESVHWTDADDPLSPALQAAARAYDRAAARLYGDRAQLNFPEDLPGLIAQLADPGGEHVDVPGSIPSRIDLELLDLESRLEQAGSKKRAASQFQPEDWTSSSSLPTSATGVVPNNPSALCASWAGSRMKLGLGGPSASTAVGRGTSAALNTASTMGIAPQSTQARYVLGGSRYAQLESSSDELHGFAPGLAHPMRFNPATRISLPKPSVAAHLHSAPDFRAYGAAPSAMPMRSMPVPLSAMPLARAPMGAAVGAATHLSLASRPQTLLQSESGSLVPQQAYAQSFRADAPMAALARQSFRQDTTAVALAPDGYVCCTLESALQGSLPLQHETYVQNTSPGCSLVPTGETVAAMGPRPSMPPPPPPQGFHAPSQAPAQAFVAAAPEAALVAVQSCGALAPGEAFVPVGYVCCVQGKAARVSADQPATVRGSLQPDGFLRNHSKLDSFMQAGKVMAAPPPPPLPQAFARFGAAAALASQPFGDLAPGGYICRVGKPAPLGAGLQGSLPAPLQHSRFHHAVAHSRNLSSLQPNMTAACFAAEANAKWLASAHLSAPLTMQRPSTGIAHWF